MTLSPSTLLPCPFCGVVPAPGELTKWGKSQISCDNEDCPIQPHTEYSDRDTASEWNRRAPPLEVPPEGDPSDEQIAHYAAMHRAGRWIEPADFGFGYEAGMQAALRAIPREVPPRAPTADERSYFTQWLALGSPGMPRRGPAAWIIRWPNGERIVSISTVVYGETYLREAGCTMTPLYSADAWLAEASLPRPTDEK